MIESNKETKKQLKAITTAYRLELVVLFGSRVTGKTHKESDYDIGYISKKRLSLSEEGQLIQKLMPIIRVQDERKINLVNLRKSTPLMLYAATSNSEVLFEKNETLFATVRAFAFKQYIETIPLFEQKKRRLEEVLTQKP